MNDSVYKISLDIYEHASQAVLKAKKTDTGRKLHITLRAGGTPYTIANDCYAAFKATKPDGTVLFNACTIENNEIIYEFTKQTCTSVGRCKCEIALYGPDEKIITSPRFSLLVDGMIYPDEIVESTDEFSALAGLITDTLEATHAATQAAQKADQASNDANEFINKYGDHPIKFIDNTNGEVKTVLHELPEGAYMLTGFFPYTREYDEEGIYFSNDLVSVEKYEVEDSVVVQFLVGRYLHSANITSNHVDYEKIPLRNLENKENRVPTIDENSDDEHYPTAKAVYDYVGQNGGSASTPDHSMYFEIDVDGLIALKPEYRGASSDEKYITAYPCSISDQGFGNVGSKNSELPERLVLPHNVNGERVTGFQKGMFCCNHRVKEVVLPSEVKVIINGMFREAINLEKVENTEQIEDVKASGFYHTRIEEIRFPNLVSLGGNAFTNCSRLRVVDIGKITIIDNYVFEWCEHLIEVLGGENVTTIGNSAFYATRRLKKLSFLKNVTKIDSFAFYHSACDFEEVYDTLVANKCTFGTVPNKKVPNTDRYYTVRDVAPTYKHFNDMDYWSGFTPTPCKTPLRSVFHQKNPEWANEIYGSYYKRDNKGNLVTNENGDYILEEIPYSKGCSLLSLAEIYSAFEEVDFSSPEEFMDILRAKGLTDPADHNPLYRPQWCNIAAGLGYTTDYITEMTTANYQKVCNALAEGALLYKSVCTKKTEGNNAWSQPEGGHATVVYGINSAGEMLMSDTSMHCDEIGIYENHKSAWHIYKHGSKECDVVIVKKPKEE